LVGEAIPTQDKIRTLAEWLHVSVEWLRFGSNESGTRSSATNNDLHSSELKLIADLKLLDDHHQMMVREFVRILLHANLRK